MFHAGSAGGNSATGVVNRNYYPGTGWFIETDDYFLAIPLFQQCFQKRLLLKKVTNLFCNLLDMPAICSAAASDNLEAVLSVQ